METFFDHLASEQRRISCILGENYSMLPLTRYEQAEFDASTDCKHCGHAYTVTNWKVRHHCHATGRFISAVCNECNLKLKYRKRKSVWREMFNKKSKMQEKSYRGKNDDHDQYLVADEDDVDDEERCQYKFQIPIFFHNLRYDQTFIIKAMNSRMVEKFDQSCGETTSRSVKILAQNLERFISFEMLFLRFTDSCRFLNASLDSLVSSLLKSCDSSFDKFNHMRRHMGSNKLLFAKGVFPYEWHDSPEKLAETSLPPREAFYSNLNMCDISAEDYSRAQEIWNTFNCKTFKDYHDLYLKCDVLLLADVFENFRSMGMQFYGLDPAHYLSLPGYAFDACLSYTNVNLERIRDPEMFMFIESGIRGGISTCNHRYAKANNCYMKDFDPTKPSSYLMYLDANNLYGPVCRSLYLSVSLSL